MQKFLYLLLSKLNRPSFEKVNKMSNYLSIQLSKLPRAGALSNRVKISVTNLEIKHIEEFTYLNWS